MRDDDNSDACDEAPRAEDKCYTRGRLRDEFRMKPAPGAEPVKMYKNPYGGKYGVWRLADCIPMRDKRPQTEKQQLASARLGLQAKMKSERGRSAMLAHTWLSQDPLFLDTETTGLGNTAQALEIGLVNARGETVYHTRLKPTVSIEPVRLPYTASVRLSLLMRRPGLILRRSCGSTSGPDRWSYLTWILICAF